MGSVEGISPVYGEEEVKDHPSHPTHRRLEPFVGRLMVLSASLLASALTIVVPEPAFAGLEFCNRTTGGSTLALALAHYNFGIKHVRFRRNGLPGLTITLNPRWTIKGWWEIAHNECITTAIDRDLNLKHYYYYAHSQDNSYNDSGSYLLCGRKYSQFHVEYQMNDDNKPVQILALEPSGVDSISVNSAMDLQTACADLGYGLLPFNQIDVGDAEEYTIDLVD